jgi:hypothetical protein
MIGLMLAFQLDRWRDDFADRKQERTDIDRLIADVEVDVPVIQYAIDLASLRLELVELLMAVAKDPAAAVERPAAFLGAVNQGSFTYTPVLTSHTFDNLRATGDLKLIRSDSVRNVMFEYYGFDASQRQYRPLQFDTEMHHFKLVAGVLSHEQERYVQDTWMIIGPDEIDAIRESAADLDGVMAAAERLRSRPDLVAWLPYLRQLQLEQIMVHEVRLENAHRVLETLHEYQGSLRGGAGESGAAD